MSDILVYGIGTVIIGGYLVLFKLIKDGKIEELLDKLFEAKN